VRRRICLLFSLVSAISRAGRGPDLVRQISMSPVLERAVGAVKGPAAVAAVTPLHGGPAIAAKRMKYTERFTFGSKTQP